MLIFEYIIKLFLRNWRIEFYLNDYLEVVFELNGLILGDRFEGYDGFENLKVNVFYIYFRFRFFFVFKFTLFE